MGQKLRNLLKNLQFTKLLKLERLIKRFLNQIKKRVKILNLELLKFELLEKKQLLLAKLFLILKLKLILLMLQLTNL